MYKTYIKQALKILKQNRFISIISIIGTALAIMMVMVVIVTDAIKNVNIAPEVNRSRTYYAGNYTKINKNQGTWMTAVDYKMYKDYFSGLKTPLIMSVISNTYNTSSNFPYMVKKYGINERTQEYVKLTDANFWKIMSFSFLEGKPFTQEEFDSGANCAVISETLAKKVFGNNTVIGKDIEIDFNSYKVIGVVKDIPESLTYAYAAAFIPITAISNYEKARCQMLILLNNETDLPLLKEEFESASRKYNILNEGWDMRFHEPYNHRQTLMKPDAYKKPDEGATRRKMIFMFAMLLLIPAVNLSNFSMSQVKNRTEEIGIRKAFGAKKLIIVIQILFENFITSIIGGIMGLGFSYIIVVWLKSWLLDISAESSIPIEALISMPVLIGVFIACFILNLLSAGIPAYIASRSKIVDSINNKNV